MLITKMDGNQMEESKSWHHLNSFLFRHISMIIHEAKKAQCALIELLYLRWDLKYIILVIGLWYHYIWKSDHTDISVPELVPDVANKEAFPCLDDEGKGVYDTCTTILNLNLESMFKLVHRLSVSIRSS